MGRVSEMAWEQQQAQQALDLAEMERDRYREMRRKVLEEAACVVDPKHKPRVNRSSGEHGRIAESTSKSIYEMRKQFASAIRDLADRDPPEAPCWRDSLGPEDRYESNKGPANG